jgi:hypothetical protein
MFCCIRAAAQAVFSEFLSNRSLTPPQIRFIEMVIDQLTSRGVIEAIFEKLKAVESELIEKVG